MILYINSWDTYPFFVNLTFQLITPFYITIGYIILIIF